MARLEDKYEKEGVFIGRRCINPVTGKTMPIYAANFVLMDYGTGAVMCVPAHDQRDFEFAKKYKLPIKVVIKPDGCDLCEGTMDHAWEGEGTLIGSEAFDGMRNVDAIPAIARHLEKSGRGGQAITYKLKDWCISRQRYWGAPIPIVYCKKCDAQAVKEKDLPVLLPYDVKFTGEGGSPLARCRSFAEAKCPKCGGPAKRETDTMDTFVESSWYMLRYACPKYDKGPVDREEIDYWLPVDQYIGGIEHAVGHLIYCRYFTKVLRDLGFVSLGEPAANLMTQGMVYKDGAKMSKSKGNVVDPDDMIAKYGADTMRLFSLFAAPPEKDLEWNDQGVEGSHRFLIRTWRFVSDFIERAQKGANSNEETMRWTARTVKKVTEDIERFHFNTAIAAVMEYINYLQSAGSGCVGRDAIEKLVLLISPFAPHISEELWHMLGHKKFTLEEEWPAYDASKLETQTVTIIVQVNGKLRDKIEVASNASEEEVRSLALKGAKVEAALGGRPAKKVIYVPQKLINIVI
jgi:leucyl-tRNA synthetase